MTKTVEKAVEALIAAIEAERERLPSAGGKDAENLILQPLAMGS
jgi:hypothetical protein